MKKRNESYVQEFVLVFGFLNGLWISSGVNPEAEILKAFTDLVPEMSTLFFWGITITLTIGTIWSAYVVGKWLGLVAVLAAFLGGVFIDSWGIWSLLMGVGIGWIAPTSKKRRSR